MACHVKICWNYLKRILEIVLDPVTPSTVNSSRQLTLRCHDDNGWSHDTTANRSAGTSSSTSYRNGPITIAIRARFEYDSTAIHPTRSYVLSSNNEHVNSFALL